MNKIIEVIAMPPKPILDQGHKSRKYFEKLVNGTYVIKKLKEGEKVRVFFFPKNKSLFAKIVILRKISIAFLESIYKLTNFLLL